MEVHFFTEYHGSTEQYYVNMAKGCEEMPTIKDDTHQRRGHSIHVVSFSAETDFQSKKEELLSRDKTKQRVIPMISDALREERMSCG